MKPDVYSGIGSLAARYGVEAAAEVADLEEKHIEAIESLIKREQISCDFEINRAIDTQLEQSYNTELLARYKGLVANGSEPTKRVVYKSGSEAERVSANPHTHGPLSQLLFVVLFCSSDISQSSSLELKEPLELSLTGLAASGRIN